MATKTWGPPSIELVQEVCLRVWLWLWEKDMVPSPTGSISQPASSPPVAASSTLPLLPSKRKHADAPGRLILISIIVPMRNARPFLDECLESVAQQDFVASRGSEVEVSVYNDGSTDDSLSMLEGWRPRLEALGIELTVSGSDPAPKGGGCGFAKNRAVAQSRGKYLCFLDADDVMLPRRLSAQLEVFEGAHPRQEQFGGGGSAGGDEVGDRQGAGGVEDLLLGSCYERLPKDSTPRYTDWHNKMTKQQLLLQQYKECTVAMPTWFLTRALFDRVGPFVEKPAEDLMFFQKHCAMGGRVDRVEEVLLVYRYHQSSVTFGVSPAEIRAVKVRHLEASLISKLERFSIWGGKEARDCYRAMGDEARAKMVCFLDIDPKKIQQPYTCREHPRKVPVRLWKEAKLPENRPIVICVKPGLTSGVFEENLATLGLTEGVDFWFFG